MASYQIYCRTTRKSQKKCLREMLNVLFYISKSGCQWRMLPSDFAPW
ncbi:MAG: transposase [Bacteroides sp.]|nr:transposase [Bacteroides sp.]MDE5761220.1 transposase [Bacteroides sp.]MDE6215531.1 transposase [Bacteroides sp.]